MKKSMVPIAILITGFVAGSVLFTSCGSKQSDQQEQKEGEDHQHMEGDTTSHHDEMNMDSTQMAYACPMHSEVTGKAGDSCSKCGMNLEPANSTKVGEKH